MLTVYRKYRAQNFAEIIGQEHIVTVLKQAVKEDRMAHAYLFSGPRGTGKTSMARIMAKAVNCLDLQQGEPCGKCANCKAIHKGSFMDLIEIDAASNRGIDEIRELKSKVGFLPAEGKFKVYIIDEVHMMTEPAFNALLKTLEEPPQQVLFILATTEPQKLPLTIISRTQRFDFKLADDQALETKLSKIIKSEKRRFSKEALELIIRAGQGSFRDAETVLDKVLSAMKIPESEEVLRQHVEGIMGYISKVEVGSFIDLLLENERLKAFDLLHDIQSRSGNLIYFIKEVLEECRLRMILLVRSGRGNVNLKKYMQIIKEFNEAATQLRSSLIPVLSLEMAIANVTDDKQLSSASAIELEKELKSKTNKAVAEVIKEEVNKSSFKQDLEDNIKECDLLNLKWQEILQAAKKYNHFLTAILAKVKVEPGKEPHLMELKVGSTFHKKRLESKETRDILTGLFNEVCGITIDYKCIIDKNIAQSSKESNSKLVEEFFN